jgi:hypothetical protein
MGYSLTLSYLREIKLHPQQPEWKENRSLNICFHSQDPILPSNSILQCKSTSRIPVSPNDLHKSLFEPLSNSEQVHFAEGTACSLLCPK